MKFEPVPLSEAKGKILGHNIAGANGQRLLRKGKPLTDEDLENLRALGRTSVYVAQMDLRVDVSEVWEHLHKPDERIFIKLILPAGTNEECFRYLTEQGITGDFLFPD